MSETPVYTLRCMNPACKHQWTWPGYWQNGMACPQCSGLGFEVRERQEQASQIPQTLDYLQSLCREWQKILRLQDWEIAVEFKRERDLGEHNYARVPHQPQFKRARVQILDEVDRDPDYLFFNRDYECDLVHELLELHFSPFKTAEDGPELTAQELAINLIADALLRLKRGGRGA